MANESGFNVQMSYVAEVTQNVTPGSPTMKALRLTARNINAKKEIIKSDEVRFSRQVKDVRHGFRNVVGSPSGELAVQVYDDMIEGFMGSSWAAVTIAGTPNLAVDGSLKTFTRATGSFITDGLRPGDVVDSSAFSNAGNNGRWRVTAVTATVITVDPPTGVTMVTEASAGGRTIAYPGKRITTGVVMKTFTFERRFIGINQYQIFRGVAINSAKIGIQPGQLVKLEMDLLGITPLSNAGSSLGSPTTAPTNLALNSFVGEVYEAGVKVGIITGIDIMLNNDRVLGQVVGADTSPEVFEGEQEVTGTLSLYLTDATFLNKFYNETESSLYLRFNDPNGTDFINITLPRIKYMGDDINPPQKGPVVQSLPFQALEDLTTGQSMYIQRSNT